MTRLLADENIPIEVVRFLKRSGVDITSVMEFSPGLSDTEVMELANRENRVLVTSASWWLGRKRRLRV